MDCVVDIDTNERAVVLASGRALGYDSLVIAAGAVSNDFGVPGVADHAFPLKSLDDAIALRRHVLANFEEASGHADEVAPGDLDVVICGGGPTGVEMAGGLAELYRRVLADDFPDLPVAAARIVLVEAADRLLSPFSPKSSAAALHTLKRFGVEVRLGVGLDEVDERTVRLSDGIEIPASTCVWAAGVKAHPIGEALGVPTVRGGRLPVNADLSVTECDGVFAIGDIAATIERDGNVLPQVAQPAIQGGKHVAQQIGRRIRNERSTPFRYVDKGSMATIGRHSAVAELATGQRLSGYVGWVAWLAVHIVSLMGFRNRLNVFVNWSWNYFTYDRGSRLLSANEFVASRQGRNRRARGN